MTTITAARFERPRASWAKLLDATWRWSNTPANQQTILQASFGSPYRLDHDRPVNTA